MELWQALLILYIAVAFGIAVGFGFFASFGSVDKVGKK